MMSIQEMNRLADEAAARAYRENKRPKVFGTYLGQSHKRDMLIESVRNIPNLGSYRPDGWELVPLAELSLPENMTRDRLSYTGATQDGYVMVDSSGFGSRGEPALMFSELCDLVAANPTVGWAICEEGQFQVVLGIFRPVEGQKPPKAPPRMTKDKLIRAFVEGKPGRSHNAHTDGKVFTLHATPIVYRNRLGGVTINWGGWYTKTTADYMRRILREMGLPSSVVKTPGQAEKAGDDRIDVTVQ